FQRYLEFPKLDLLINECGIFSDLSSEIAFADLIQKVREINPQKTIMTHIEEIEINIWGEEHLEKLKTQYQDLNIEFAYDGMNIIF
ncbi:MAG TPA: hypothetical protein PLQ36_03530, partial [Candidatus Gracilibacteria bacterium]|nr:hypothetical protein [Candidatus Gracilibacteria bacterium]